MNSRHHASVAFISVSDLIRDKSIGCEHGDDDVGDDLKLHCEDDYQQFVISTRDAIVK